MVCVRVVYDSDGPWVSVDTARWTAGRATSGPLRWMVEHRLRQQGQWFSALDWSEGDATVIVDGEPVAGRIVRAGGRWWAARCQRGEVEISVAAQDWHPDVIAVETVADVTPMVDRLRLPEPRHRQAEPVPEARSGEPLRALADTVLAATARHRDWMAGGGPEPRLPGYWTALWRAAVARQIALTDQPEPVARESVHTMVDHLANLHGNAAWFRDEPDLRERAIAETLLYGTELSEAVPSRLAQLAGRRRQTAARHGRPEATIAADRDWLASWATWADALRRRDG